jgi:hypothetical protein
MLGFCARASRISSLASGRGGPRYCGGQQSGLKKRLPSPTANAGRGGVQRAPQEIRNWGGDPLLLLPRKADVLVLKKKAGRRASTAQQSPFDFDLLVLVR